jgi:nucleotide-binding universal stress UspA family protein
MTVPNQIVLATDFSPASMSAARVAAGISLTFRARVTLLHIFEYVSRHRHQIQLGWILESIRTDVRKKLAEGKQVLNETGVEVEVIMLEGAVPAQQIVTFMQSCQNPILVMGTHAVAGMERFLLGSTAEEVLRQVRCPVVTVGPHVASSSMNDPFLKKILYATDFSDASLAAVPVLSTLRNSTAACLRILHVSLDHDPRIEETQQFDSVRRLLGASESDEYVILHGNSAAQAIVDEADKCAADLIVLGVKRASAFVVHVAPKITFQIVAASPCAVLTISS